MFVNGSVEGTLLEDFVSAIAARHDLLPDEVNVESIHVGEGGYQLRVCVLERLCMEIEVYRSKGAQSPWRVEYVGLHLILGIQGRRVHR